MQKMCKNVQKRAKNVQKPAAKVRPRDTRPQDARTLTMHVFE